MTVAFYVARVVLSVAAAACICFPAFATSIIVQIDPDKIIMLADSRAGLLSPGGNAVRDDQCKIVILDGQLIFAETGYEGYTPTGIADPVPAWHGTSEAVKASTTVPDHDLHKVALAWAIQVTNNFQRFYLAAPQRVRQLAVRPGVPLLVGLFGGKDSGDNLEVYVVRIALDDSLLQREGAAIPIGYSIDKFPLRGAPVSTNGVTQELLDGQSDRAKQVAGLWAAKSGLTANPDREWRRLEFMIEQTGNYDDSVHGPVNVIRVTGSSTIWLQNNTCRG